MTPTGNSGVNTYLKMLFHKGKEWQSIGLDEAHEMLVNRDCKAVVVHPNKEFISRMALYFPKSIKNFKNQITPQGTCNESNQSTRHIAKAGENVQAMKLLLSNSDTLPEHTTSGMVLRNGFTGTKANSAQHLDLINFRNIGQSDFDA